MVAFVLLKKYLSFLGLLRESNRDSVSSIIPICIYVGLLGSFFLSAFLFFFFEAKVLNEFTGSFYFMCVSLLAFSWHSNYLWKSDEYAELFHDFDKIIERRKLKPLIYVENNNYIYFISKLGSQTPVVKMIYQTTLQKLEILTKKTHFYLMRTSVPIFTTLDMVLSMIGYMFFEVDPNSFQLTYLGSFPINWKTPSGYLMVGTFEAVSILAAAEMYAITLVLNLGYCYILSDFVMDLEESLAQLNQEFIAMSNQNFNVKRQIGIKRKLHDIFQFNAEARE